jgi:hypothetical protein
MCLNLQIRSCPPFHACNMKYFILSLPPASPDGHDALTLSTRFFFLGPDRSSATVIRSDIPRECLLSRQITCVNTTLPEGPIQQASPNPDTRSHSWFLTQTWRSRLPRTPNTVRCSIHPEPYSLTAHDPTSWGFCPPLGWQKFNPPMQIYTFKNDLSYPKCGHRGGPGSHTRLQCRNMPPNAIFSG